MSFRGWLEQRFFRPAPLVDLAVLRCLVVAMQLFVMLVPYAFFTYPVWGRLALLTELPDSSWEPVPLLRLLLAPFGGERPSLAAMTWVLRGTIAAGFFALVGAWTRPACLLFALGNLVISAYGYSYGEHHHIEALTLVVLFALAASPSGAKLSIDAWRTRGRAAARASESDLARWPLELTRWMFALVYLSAAAAKLVGSGLRWLNGYTLQTYLLQEGLFWGTSSSVWLARHHELCIALSCSAVLIEGLFFLVIPRPRLALFFVPAAAAMHLVIQVTMRAPFVLYLPLYAAFVPWSRLLAPRDAPSAARAGGARK